MVNVSTARCLDVAGDFDNGTDVVTAPCSSARSQRWRVDSDRGVLQSAADPDFCLDSRGDVDKGLGIWSCDSVEGDNSDNLRFTVDPDGVIRPAIAIATGMTPGRRGRCLPGAADRGRGAAVAGGGDVTVAAGSCGRLRPRVRRAARPR